MPEGLLPAAGFEQHAAVIVADDRVPWLHGQAALIMRLSLGPAPRLLGKQWAELVTGTS